MNRAALDDAGVFGRHGQGVQYRRRADGPTDQPGIFPSVSNTLATRLEKVSRVGNSKVKAKEPGPEVPLSLNAYIP